MSSCIVTGVNQGIGLALADALAKCGYFVIGLHRKNNCSSDLLKLKIKYPLNIITIGGIDMADINSLKTIKNALINYTNDIQYIFNVAGVSAKNFDSTKKSTSNIGHLNVEHLKMMFDINVFSPIFLVQELLDLLKISSYAGNCWIINISSRDASFSIKSRPGNYGYCSSKVALNMMTKCLALELKELHLGGAFAIHPGWVKTAMGGDNGNITANECAQNIINLTLKITDDYNGQFLNTDGTLHSL